MSVRFLLIAFAETRTMAKDFSGQLMRMPWAAATLVMWSFKHRVFALLIYGIFTF